jgi:hypothetical protein
MVETDKGESSSPQHDKDVEMGILDRISEGQQHIFFFPSEDNENDSQDSPPPEATGSTMEDDSKDVNSDEYQSAETSSSGDNLEDNSEEKVDLENPKEDDKEEITSHFLYLTEIYRCQL